MARGCCHRHSRQTPWSGRTAPDSQLVSHRALFQSPSAMGPFGPQKELEPLRLSKAEDAFRKLCLPQNQVQPSQWGVGGCQTSPCLTFHTPPMYWLETAHPGWWGGGRGTKKVCMPASELCQDKGGGPGPSAKCKSGAGPLSPRSTGAQLHSHPTRRSTSPDTCVTTAWRCRRHLL